MKEIQAEFIIIFCLSDVHKVNIKSYFFYIYQSIKQQTY